MTDVKRLRRTVCREQGHTADECERRVREDEDRYEFELGGAARDAVPRLLLRSGP